MADRIENLSTLCYLEQDGKYLMLHRTVKKNDVNRDKWIGVGGHFEEGESPEECIMREVREETGYTLTSFRQRGILTFICGSDAAEYIFLFTADGFTGTPIACDEGELEWVPKEEIENLNLWEGDKIFFRLLKEESPFFSLKFVYNAQRELTEAALNGENLLQIRYADINDLDAVTAVEAACFPEAEAAGRESFRSRLETFSNHFWVMEYEGKIVAFVNGMVSDDPGLRDEMFDNAGLHNEKGAWQMIFGVDTLPEYRRRGYAAAVLRRAIADAREQGRKGLVLTCKEHMLHYYEKFGFINEGLSASAHGGAVWYDMRLVL